MLFDLFKHTSLFCILCLEIDFIYYILLEASSIGLGIFGGFVLPFFFLNDSCVFMLGLSLSGYIIQ